MSFRDDLPPQLVEILQRAELRGEHTVNRFRAGFYGLSALMLAANLGANTLGANIAFTLQVGAMLVYSAGVAWWFKRNTDVYAPWLKYVSITVDLAALHASAVIMAYNHAGVIEYFHGFVPIVLVLWNLFAALRYSAKAALYSGFLSLALSSLLLGVVVATEQVAVSPVSVYGSPAIHVGDEVVRLIFIALPAFFGALIARSSRGLVLRAEAESQARRELENQKDRLSKYLSRDLVDAVLANPELMRLGGARRDATVLFCDIRDFTPLAEASSPEEVVQMLNAHFTEMVEIVFRYGGTLDKFLGDGLMAVFSAPTTLPDHELRAVLVALAMVDAVEKFNATHRSSSGNLPPISVGVGIASGPIVAGNIGSPDRMEYTAIGDTVNFAARLEALTKSVGAQIVMSAATHAAVKDFVPTRALPSVAVKGKTGRPELFTVDVDALGPGLLQSIEDQLAAYTTMVANTPTKN